MSTADLAPRLRAPSWRDPRLVVGVLLVLGSILLGTWAVGANDRTQGVWAVQRTVTPGDDVGREVLRVVPVHLASGISDYLSADLPLPAHLVALRTVGAGELLPRDAVGRASALERRPVGLVVTGPLATGIVKGSSVDVWVTVPTTAAQRSGAGGAYQAPRLLAPSAEVSEVSGARTSIGADGTTTVQVLLDPAELRDALAAQAAQARVALVLVPGSTPSEG